MRVVLLGPPGAGKGTQAASLARRLGVPHVASGDLFREHLAQGTTLGREAKAYMDTGGLVPDSVTIGMILERIARPDCGDGVVLDGFPRALEQARALDEALEAQGQRIDAALYLRVSSKELMARLGGRRICRRCQAPYHLHTAPPKQPGVCDRCGGELEAREDDRPDAVRRRIEVYFDQTAPLVDHYARQGRLREVDGKRSIDQVGQDMMEALGVKAQGRRRPFSRGR